MRSAPAMRPIDFSRSCTYPSACHARSLAGLGLALRQHQHGVVWNRFIAYCAGGSTYFQSAFLEESIPTNRLDFLSFHNAFAVASPPSFPLNQLFMHRTMSGSSTNTGAYSCLSTKLPKTFFEVY